MLDIISINGIPLYEQEGEDDGRKTNVHTENNRQ